MSTTNEFILEDVKNHYESCLNTHKGDIVKEVDWTTPEASEVRYRKFRDFFFEFSFGCDDFNRITTSTVLLDFGCGTGSLLGNRYPFIPYTGCDISVEMVEEAKRRFPNRNFFVFDGKSLPSSYDVIVANGTFTEKLDWSTWEFYSYLLDQLKMLLEHTNKGLAFNVMDWHKIKPGTHKENLFFMKYSQIATLMQELKVSKYVIDASYELNDVLIKIYK